MLDTINQFKNRLFIFSFGLGLASTISVFQPNETIKNIGKVSTGFAIAGVVLGEMLTSKVNSEVDKANKINGHATQEANNQIVEITRKLDKTTNDLVATKKDSERLEGELQQALEYLQTRNNEITTANSKVIDLQNKLRDVGRFSSSEAHKMVRETYNRSVRKLEAHIEALMRNYSPIADDFNHILIEVDKLRNRYFKKLEEYEALTSFNDLIDIGLDMQDKIINQCIELRVKGQSIAIRYLDSLLEDAVSYGQYEQDVTNLQNHAGQTIQQLKAESEAQVRAVVSDWVLANNQHIENYEVNYTQLIEDGKQAIEGLKKREAIINERDSLISELQAELTELRKPWRFTGSIDYAVAGNAIINFYHSSYGYTLDAMMWEETETGYLLTFGTSRNKTYLTADMLHDKDNQHQLAGLCNALTLPTFTANYQSGLMVLEVVTRKVVKKQQSNEKDISKLWKTVDKFEETVKGWSRIRLTGGSESGKSPTAENIACVILKHRPGTAKLYNPQHNSQKNYWTIPVIGTSHKDSEKAIASLAKQIDARSNGQEARDIFELSLFDEIDSTMSHTKAKKSVIGNDVNFIIKQASHQNLGAIFVGQNANVSEYPGMDRSDWNSAVNVHIGDNAKDALTNTNLLTAVESEKYKGIADRLIEYCNQKNEELGLDSKHDIEAYRFALVMEPGKRPYFIELPAYGAFTYDSIPVISVQEVGQGQAGQAGQAGLETRNTYSTVAGNRQDSGYVGSTCPKCKTGVLSSDGKTKGINYYLCSHCGKKTSENVLMKQEG